MDDADDLGLAVAGFRRAERALAAIAADADRLVGARAEVELARDELKVVAGALVGLATASRDLVGQLGEAAAALRPVERGDQDRVLVALRDAEKVHASQVADVAEAVEELARRLDRALADRVGAVVAEVTSRLPSAEQLDAVALRLDALDGLGELARADRLAELSAALERLPTAAQVEALEGAVLARLPEAGGPAAAGAEEVAELAATRAARAVEQRVAGLLEEVEAGQRRVRQLVLAVGVAFLLFAALISALALR